MVLGMGMYSPEVAAFPIIIAIVVVTSPRLYSY